MPRLRKARSRALLTAGSSAATSRGRASTIVTSAPNERMTEANSTPMTPPPSTTTRPGTCVEPQHLVARHDRSADLEARQRAGEGAGGEHDVLRRRGAGHRRRPCGRPRAGRRPRRSRPCCFETRPCSPLCSRLTTPFAVCRDRRHVDALERRANTEARGLAGGVGDLGGVEQRLGGDAAAVQAGAPEEVLLDEGDAHARARRRAARRHSLRCLPRGRRRHGWSRRWPASLAAPLLWRRWGAGDEGVAVRTLASILVTPRVARTHLSRGDRTGWAEARTPYRVRMAWWRRGRGQQAPHGGGDLASARAHFEDFIRYPARRRGLRRAGHQRHRDHGGAHRARR